LHEVQRYVLQDDTAVILSKVITVQLSRSQEWNLYGCCECFSL